MVRYFAIQYTNFAFFSMGVMLIYCESQNNLNPHHQFPTRLRKDYACQHLSFLHYCLWNVCIEAYARAISMVAQLFFQT